MGRSGRDAVAEVQPLVSNATPSDSGVLEPLSSMVTGPVVAGMDEALVVPSEQPRDMLAPMRQHLSWFQEEIV